MIRNLTDHRVNGLNEALIVQAVDQPGPGGANHHYSLFIPDQVELKPGVTVHQSIKFQNGPIASEADFNGVTTEALVAIAIDRMRGFQFQRTEVAATEVGVAPGFDFKKPGPFSCKENAMSLTHLEEALMWLQKRTRDRQARGVEGSMKV